MKHIKLYEEFVNEKAYRMTGIYTSKGIIGKVMQAFKKEIERITYDGDADATLKEVNKEWLKFEKTAADIILKDIEKAVKNMKETVHFVTADLATTWMLDDVNKLNTPNSSVIYITPGEFVINVGFMDDADASRFSRKLGGMLNSPLEGNGSMDLYGSFDSSVGDNNVEIRGSEFINIDAK